MVNYEIKSQLAKLLATEDLVVEHKNISTAQFNVESRVLTLPLWKKATNIVYDLLVGHEVGHALYTPNRWGFKIPQQFVNVVEDARIDKLMKRKYPGLSKTFYYGYQELNDNDFFDIDGEDLTTLNLADRGNLYFKVGNFVDISFSTVEKKIISLIESCETFDDTLAAAAKLYEYCKEEVKQKEKSVEVISNKDISPDPDQGNETFEEEFFDEGYQDEELSEGEIEKIIENKGASNSSPEPEVSTDTAFHERTQELNDFRQHRENVYLELPKLILDNVIASNSEIHSVLEESWKTQSIPMEQEDPYTGRKVLYKADFDYVDEEYNEFKNNAKKEVNYLVKEFESKKAADSYARAATSKTGILDCSKLHTYKYNEDLFRKVTTLADGKNHGLIFMLDWSGSMHYTMHDTIKQLFNLIWFCNKVNIPFEVYAFTNGYENWKEGNSLPRMEKEEYKLVVNEDFTLMNFLTSKVSKNVLEKQMKSLWRVVYAFKEYGVQYTLPGQFHLGGTPFNEALISLHQIIPHFQKETKIQKVQCILLTDGEANVLPYHKWVSRAWEMEPFMGCRNIHPQSSYIRNRKTGHIYQVDYQFWKFGEILLKDLKQSFPDTNFIGIRLVSNRDFGSFIRRYQPLDDKEMRQARREKSYNITTGGYDSYFVMNASSLSSDDSFEVEEDASKARIRNAFSKSLKSKALNKKVLSKFMDLVC